MNNSRMNIRTEVDYVTESISLLMFLGNENSYEEWLRNCFNKSIYDYDKFHSAKEKEITLLSKIEEEFKKEFKEDWDNYQFYFGAITDNGYKDCVGRILLLWEEFHRKNLYSFDEFKKLMLNMSPDEYRSSFANILQGISGALRDNSQYVKLESDSAILSYIIDLNISKENCIKLQSCYLDYDAHLNTLLNYIERTIAILQKHDKELCKLLNDMKIYWKNKLNGLDIIEYFALNSELVASLPQNPLGTIITPDICAPFRQGISVDSDEETGEFTSPYTVPLGILLCDERPPEFTEGGASYVKNTEYYLTALKLISEKNRFEILSQIKNAPAFGNEIANRLGLTTATVSHHMNLLLTNNLVNYKQEGTRLYYYTNQEMLTMCVQFVRDELNI